MITQGHLLVRSLDVFLARALANLQAPVLSELCEGGHGRNPNRTRHIACTPRAPPGPRFASSSWRLPAWAPRKTLIVIRGMGAKKWDSRTRMELGFKTLLSLRRFDLVSPVISCRVVNRSTNVVNFSTRDLGNTFFTERRHSEQSAVGLTESYETPPIAHPSSRHETTTDTSVTSVHSARRPSPLSSPTSGAPQCLSTILRFWVFV